MIRAAIYARFSSDLQNDRSVDDQIALCREVAAREGMAVVATYDDRAVSGSNAINRPGFQSMMRAAEARAFDVIVAEDIDRLFRDQGDYHTARKHLDFLGITLHTALGKLSKIDGALRAMMSEMYIENLALHTRRGLEGVVRSGRHAGGRAYGYRPVQHKTGELEIVPDEAEIVQRIFADYIAGRTPRDIAGTLNAENVKPPRGRQWNASTINGNKARGHGIILNELYAGRIVWNKVRMIKDPATGKRLSRPNAKEHHRVADAPHLRIVDDKTWQAAQLTKAARSAAHEAHTPRTHYMLSGLIRCGSCGGAMASIGTHKGTPRLQCSAHRESGACDNGRRVNREAIEDTVLAGLKRELKKPAYIAEYLKAYNEERTRLARTATNDRSKLVRRLGEIGREIDRAVTAIVKAGVDPTTLAPTIRALEAERDQITATLAAAEIHTKVVTLHPAALERYHRDINNLARFGPKTGIGTRDDLVETLRRLVDSVIVYAKPGETGFEVEVKGRLQELLEIPTFPHRSTGGSPMVAREGLEPPTPGL